MQKKLTWTKLDNTNEQGLIGVAHLVTYTSDRGAFVIGKVLSHKGAGYILYEGGVQVSKFAYTLNDAKNKAWKILQGREMTS
jgi:hypothetical protein